MWVSGRLRGAACKSFNLHTLCSLFLKLPSSIKTIIIELFSPKKSPHFGVFFTQRFLRMPLTRFKSAHLNVSVSDGKILVLIYFYCFLRCFPSCASLGIRSAQFPRERVTFLDRCLLSFDWTVFPVTLFIVWRQPPVNKASYALTRRSPCPSQPQTTRSCVDMCSEIHLPTWDKVCLRRPSGLVCVLTEQTCSCYLSAVKS